MLASALITLREGLEAALIVGIILSVLRRLGQRERAKAVWAGVGAAAGVSVAAGVGLTLLGTAFEGRGEQLFEGITMLLAAGVLTWMIFWMQRQGRAVQAALERDVREVVAAGAGRGLFLLAFVAVVREGIETALFLTAAAFSTGALQTVLGGIAGLSIAVLIGWLIFALGKRLNLRAFFRVTGLLLLLVAAGLLAHGIHELHEASVIPPVIEHVWDINYILDERGAAGTLLRSLFGYNGNPSLVEAIAYSLYLALVGVLSWRPGRRGPLTAGGA